jgi:hypothetical protein
MKSNKLPKSDSITELAKFWDTHDLTDVEGELEEVTQPPFERSPLIKAHKRLARECAKLNPNEEKKLAEEGLAEDLEQWPA